jgi:hypothetical protein
MRTFTDASHRLWVECERGPYLVIDLDTHNVTERHTRPLELWELFDPDSEDLHEECHRELLEARDEAYDDGWEDGHREGYKEGYDEGKKDAVK